MNPNDIPSVHRGGGWEATPSMNPNDIPRVLRGGGWDSDVPSWVPAASRFTFVPAYLFSNIGFRTALTGRMPR